MKGFTKQHSVNTERSESRLLGNGSYTMSALTILGDKLYLGDGRTGLSKKDILVESLDAFNQAQVLGASGEQDKLDGLKIYGDKWYELYADYKKINDVIEEYPHITANQTAVTGASGLAFWVKNLGASTYGMANKRNILNTTNAGVEMWLSGGTTLNARVADGTNTALLSQALTGVDLTEDVWHSVIVNIPASGNMEVFADIVSKGTQSTGSVASVNNSRDGYIFARDNNGTIQDKAVGDFSNLVWKKEVFSSAQRTDYHTNGILDLDSTDIEIVHLPLNYDNRPLPVAALGGFYA